MLAVWLICSFYKNTTCSRNYRIYQLVICSLLVLLALFFKLLDCRRQLVRVDIWAAAPVKILAVFLKISPIVLVIHFAWMIRVFPLVKVDWLMFDVIFLMVASYCPLFFFKHVFELGC